eukprot:SAG31_NODE_32988_length_349_cov_0.904000_2_plen_46_part_01
MTQVGHCKHLKAFVTDNCANDRNHESLFMRRRLISSVHGGTCRNGS